MKYQIVGKNIDVTNAISNTIQKKLDHLNKFFVIKDDVTCRVVVRSYKVGAKVEITIFTPMMDVRADFEN
jgi:putative sigma-54 modulation protein